MDSIYAQVLTRPERRRRFSHEHKQRILAEALEPGASISQVAHRHGLHPNQIFTWRRLARQGALTGPGPASFMPVVIGEDVSGPAANRAAPQDAPCVEVVLGNGRLVRVAATIDPTSLVRLVAALER